MRRKLYWGIAVLIIILFVAGNFLLIQRSIETEPDVVFEPLSPEVIPKINDDIAERKVEDTVKSPPSGEAEENGYWHGDHWHKTQPPPLQGKKLHIKKEFYASLGLVHFITVSKVVMLPTEKEFYSLGLVPPPKGFYYRMHTDNTPVLGENGKPRLFTYYEPVFSVFTRIDFAPTPEQYAHYQKLVSELEAAYRNKDDVEYARITAKIEKFEASAQAEIPDFTYSVGVPTHLYETGAYQNEIRRRAKEMRAKLYEEWGLGHLPAY